MKACVILAIILATTIFTIADARAATGSKVHPKDQPNFRSNHKRENRWKEFRDC